MPESRHLVIPREREGEVLESATVGEGQFGRRLWAYANRAYSERGLDAVFVMVRLLSTVLLIVGLGLAMWGIGELDERGITSEGEDAVLTVAAIVIVALVAGVLGRWFASPWLELQDARLREAHDHERALRIELERELDVRQAFVEQANHHLRTPVTVVYGMAELIAEHGDRMSPSQQAMLHRVVVGNALTLKTIVEDLSTFLDERVASLVADRIVADPYPERESHRPPVLEGMALPS